MPFSGSRKAGGILLICIVALGSRRGTMGNESTETATAYMQGAEREALLAHLEGMSRSYDESVHLIAKVPNSTNDYTNLVGKRAHPVRSSVSYATMLLEANAEPYRRRAIDVLRKVVALQDTNDSSLTYGLWPYYLEEPLDEMFMPDFNWAAFIGKELLYVLIHHEAQLPEPLREDVRQAVYRACECIRRRPLHMGYTNIAAMSSYVALVAGERLGDPNLLRYGRWLFDKWYDYTVSLGSFTEFNSPTYTRVALGVVSRMMADILDEERRANARALNYMLWKHLARRFHEPTRQWAGPFSRAYRDLVGEGYPRMIQRAFGDAVRLLPLESLGPDIGDWRHPYRGPAKLAPYFQPLEEPRTEVEVFFERGQDRMNGMGNRRGGLSAMDIVATSYLHPAFALGTFNFMDFWEQHRNLMAHWGTPEKTTYLTMRCRNQEHGFCSAVFTSAQEGGNVLVAVSFATNHGDRYIDLDPLTNRPLRTDSLRVEFEFGGYLSEARLPPSADLSAPFTVRDRQVAVAIRFLGGTFGGNPPHAEIRRTRRRAILVLHLYEGEEKEFDLKALEQAFCLFAVRVQPIGDMDWGPEPPVVGREDGTCRAAWNQLELRIPVRPVGLEQLQTDARATVAGRPAADAAATSHSEDWPAAQALQVP